MSEWSQAGDEGWEGGGEEADAAEGGERGKRKMAR